MEARQGAPSAEQGAALDVLHVHVLRAAAQDVGQAGVGGLVVQAGAPGGGGSAPGALALVGAPVVLRIMRLLSSRGPPLPAHRLHVSYMQGADSLFRLASLVIRPQELLVCTVIPPGRGNTFILKVLCGLCNYKIMHLLPCMASGMAETHVVYIYTTADSIEGLPGRFGTRESAACAKGIGCALPGRRKRIACGRATGRSGSPAACRRCSARCARSGPSAPAASAHHPRHPCAPAGRSSVH